MKDERKHSLKRGLMAAAATGMLVVAQPTTAGADHVNQPVQPTTFTFEFPVEKIAVPANFKFCSMGKCVQDEDVPAQNGGTLLLAVTADPSTIAHLSAVPSACPKTQSGEQLLGQVITLAANGDTGYVDVKGTFTPTGGTPTELAGARIEPNAVNLSPPSLRLCAMSPVA